MTSVFAWPQFKNKLIHGELKAPLIPAKYPTLEEMGIDKKISSLAQKIANLPKERLAAVAARVETLHKAHVSHNAGDNEWYTPPEIIEAARGVIGSHRL